MTQTIAAVIIAKNEEKRIAPCLESIKWCDEIIVVDDMSTDSTVDICRRYGAKVVSGESKGDLGKLWNIGIGHSNSDWILQLDADERVTNGLRKDIESILEQGSKFSAYRMGRRNYFLDKFMQYGGWHERQIKLFRKAQGHFVGHNIHAVIDVKGEIGDIYSDLDHYAFSSISQYVKRQIYYATVESRVMYEEKGRISLEEVKYNLMKRPFKLFFKLFVKKQGYRDGFHGFILSVLSAFRHLMLYTIYWERYYKGLSLRFPTDSRIKVDIVMPVAGGLDITKRCIESIITRTEAPFRIVIIDNKSDLKTKVYLKSLEAEFSHNIKLIENNENVGWLKAINHGFRNSSAPYVCIMNNDVIVRDKWLSRLCKVGDENTNIGLINPRWNAKVKGKDNSFIETDWCRGFCILIKREVIDNIGYFDESFGFGYWEDNDYSRRAISKGFLCALSLDSYVEHIKNVSVGQRMSKEEWNALFEHNRSIFEKKWGKSKRIIFALDRQTVKDRGLLQKVLDKALASAREQHRIYLFSAVPNLKIPLHTNIKLIKCLPVLSMIDTKARIFFNKRRNPEKRYNELYIGERKIQL